MRPFYLRSKALSWNEIIYFFSLLATSPTFYFCLLIFIAFFISSIVYFHKGMAVAAVSFSVSLFLIMAGLFFLAVIGYFKKNTKKFFKS